MGAYDFNGLSLTTESFDITITKNANGTYSADKGYAEIESAFIDGSIIRCVGDVILPLVDVSGTDKKTFEFSCTKGNMIYNCIIAPRTDDTVVVTYSESSGSTGGGTGATAEQLEQIQKNKDDISELSGQISDLKDNGTGTTVTSGSVKTILSNIMTIMRAQINPDGTPQVYNPDISAIADMTDELIANLGTTEEEPDEPINPDVTLSSISVIYTGGSVPVGTTLSSLKGITVTARYSDGSTAIVSGYTLSGEIVEGSNTITVTYKGMTDTFTVTGIAQSENVNVTQNGSTLTIIDVPNVIQSGTTLLIA